MMKQKGFLTEIVRRGIKEEHKLWEQKLVLKLNKIFVVGILNIVAAIIIMSFFGYTAMNELLLSTLACYLIILFLEKWTHYLFSLYSFFILTYVFFLILNLKLGIFTFTFLHYFPVIISLVQLAGRKESLIHMYILSALALGSIVLLIVGTQHHYLEMIMETKAITVVMFLNIITSFITSLVLSIILLNAYLNQERELVATIKEKNILLAEVFHRVKNNMNIITSLLNLKKNSSENQEVWEALEDCRSRVFSMALVHQNMYKQEDQSLAFKDYVEQLIGDIGNSMGIDIHCEIRIDVEDIRMDLSHAIPVGLMLNELITNSYKYARTEDKTLEINVKMEQDDRKLKLTVSDNGPGFNHEEAKKKNSLGVDLIGSLAEQLSGTYQFNNDGGTVFNLIFDQR